MNTSRRDIPDKTKPSKSSAELSSSFPLLAAEVQLLFVIIRPHGNTTYVDAAYCYRPSSVFCGSVTLVIHPKTAEPIKMPFVLRSRVNPGNHILDSDADVPWEWAFSFWGRGVLL